MSCNVDNNYVEHVFFSALGFDYNKLTFIFNKCIANIIFFTSLNLRFNK